MAQLPPDGEWLVQQIGDQVVVFQRYTEEEVVRFPARDGRLAAMAQMVIYDSDRLTAEQKSMAHFWSGYFYAHATLRPAQVVVD
ncbi:MAG TPA: hypothetical protein VIT65_23200 [Microlunatus sp.]